DNGRSYKNYQITVLDLLALVAEQRAEQRDVLQNRDPGNVVNHILRRQTADDGRLAVFDDDVGFGIAGIDDDAVRVKLVRTAFRPQRHEDLVLLGDVRGDAQQRADFFKRNDHVAGLVELLDRDLLTHLDPGFLVVDRRDFRVRHDFAMAVGNQRRDGCPQIPAVL